MCKIETKLEKLGNLQAQIEVLQSEADKLKSEIKETMDEQGKTTLESKSFTCSFKSAVYMKYSGDVVKVLKEKAPQCLVETYDLKTVKACLKSKVLSDADLSEFDISEVRTSLAIKAK